MNSRLGGLTGQKRTHFLHSRSMYDLPRQTLPPSRTCASATYHPAYAYPTRSVSFCPKSAPEPVPSPSSRRLSELPVQLDLGFPFGSLLDGDNFPLANGQPDCHSREVFPNLSRLSHRYGTSSSSGPSERAILSIENSSFTSSACTVPTSPIDSDRASSIYECAALDFPEPPPIGSPVIRKMRSSPWFLSADEVNGVLAVPARGGRVALDRLRRQSRIPPMGPETESIKPNDKENSLRLYDGHVVGRIDNREEAAFGRNSAFLDGLGKSTYSEKFLRPYDVRSREKGHPKEMPRTELPPTTFGRLPRIIRKVASMRSDSHRTQESADVPNGSTVTFQRPVPRVRSFRSILPGREEYERRTNFKQEQNSRQLNKSSFFWTKIKTDMKDRQRHQSTGHTVYENDLSFMGWKEDLNKSFIDISPDRNARPKGRGRMKSLLSKANELFSWGRSQRKAPLGGRRDF